MGSHRQWQSGLLRSASRPDRTPFRRAQPALRCGAANIGVADGGRAAHRVPSPTPTLTGRPVLMSTPASTRHPVLTASPLLISTLASTHPLVPKFTPAPLAPMRAIRPMAGAIIDSSRRGHGHDQLRLASVRVEADCTCGRAVKL